MQTIATEKIPIKLWLKNIEEGALKQAKNLANLPFAFKHVSIMPDSHEGYGMPIGGVLATTNVIIPNAVGVDIGCGMCAIKTNITELDKETLKKIMDEIRKIVPVGFNHHKNKQNQNLMPKIPDSFSNLPILNREYNSALTQIGTLGGGNHFIEIQKGSDGFIWIMIHSGSRNFGKQTADYYNKKAIGLNERWDSSIPKEWQLAFLPIESEEGQNYIKEMNYCIEFALANRKLMMDRIINILIEITKQNKFDDMINIAHNYATIENHFGKNVWIHRKGATLARQNTIGIIPGSQGSKSYIVKGKGNLESFMSCSHGAGRLMSRKKAQKELNLENEIRELNKKGIIHSIRTKKDLDEAPSCYKNINEVMKNQKDLVEILIELSPLGVIKG
jgi:tRNA-splicing ligase RtcB